MITPEIYRIKPIGAGFLAIMARPRAGEWLYDEFVGLSQLGINLTVSLLTATEIAELDLSLEAQACEAQKIQFLSFPIVDRGIPDNIAAAAALVAHLHQATVSGQGVVVHCRAGIGRSSLIAASVLLNEGLSPTEAVELISITRRVPVPDTPEQAMWVQNHARRLTYIHQ